jgi:hypothetical protein
VKAFSIETALTAGFRLIKREPLAVLMWGVAYVAVYLVSQAVMLGASFGAFLTQLGSNPQDAFQSMNTVALSNGMGFFALGWLLQMAGMFVIYGAIARAELYPDDRRFFYLRASGRELWLGLTSLALTILLGLILGVAFVIAMVPAGIMSGGDVKSGFGAILLIGIPFAVGALYVCARFGFAWIIAFDEERFSLFDSWNLTKGQGWRLVLMILGLCVLVIALGLGIFMVLGILGLVLFGLAKTLGAVGVIIAVLAGLLMLALYSVAAGASTAIFAAPWIEAYRGIRASKDAPAQDS